MVTANNNPESKLCLHGLKENNLKNLSVELEHNQLIAVTGLSGSGKSTLAFDTVYAEGQRRYLETFSSYVRQFLDKVKKPDLESSNNVRPAIAIEQKNRILSSRSNVGSLTDLNDYLGILFANFARPYSLDTGLELKKYTASEVAQALPAILSESEFIYVACPYHFNSQKKQRNQQINNLQMMGLNRFLLEDDEQPYKLSEDLAKIASQKKIYLLLDRLKTTQLTSHRLINAIEQAYQLSRGVALIASPHAGTLKFTKFTSYYSEPDDAESELKIPTPKPSMFSANNPLGACPTCKGFGANLLADRQKIITNPKLSLAENVIDCWKGAAVQSIKSKMLQFALQQKIDVNTPWNELPSSAQDLIFEYNGKGYTGVNPWFKKIEKKSYKAYVRIYLTNYRTPVPCAKCQSSGLKPEALIFQLNGLNISQVRHLPVSELKLWLESLKPQIDLNQSLELEMVFKQCLSRTNEMNRLGLDYLSLDRPARTLSGGETQRVNLVTAIGSELVSTQFVLDEPSVGLHPRDSERLMESIQALKNRGNSVLMVEHDPDCILSADLILQLGPQAGKTGGEVVYYGKPEKWKHRFSPTPIKKHPRVSANSLQIQVKTLRNLHQIDLHLPLNSLVVLTGVSGSGKSTLAREVILKAYENQQIGLELDLPFAVQGLEQLSQVLAVDQSSLVKSPRSNIATYSKLWEIIRIRLATSSLAKQKLFTKSTFSFNVEGGRCPHCQGAGYLKEEMQFLSDVYVTCDLCLGQRFQSAVLDVTYLDRNVAEWLKTTVTECQQLLTEELEAFSICRSLSKLGLGHLTLGHPLSQLSGGEAQRLKLVPFIQKAQKGNTLLIFDEPSTGLSQEDVTNLLQVFEELITAGHSVLCIEHNQDIILAADHLIDLGPEGGAHGGQVILEGPPADFLLKKNATHSLTAKYLQAYLKKYQNYLPKKNPPQKLANSNNLKIHGANEHNLKNLDLVIPHDQIVVFTGVSGSGKSTIAKDIVYAEGQRKYLDCLSPYARQFIKELAKAQIAGIENLRPTICVYQHTFQPSRLSTLGTISEIYNFLRLLFAKVGVSFCPNHPTQELSSSTNDQILQKILQFKEQPVKLLVPVIKAKKGHHRPVFEKARQAEIEEVRVDGVFGPIRNFEEGLSRNQVHNIDYVYAKIVPARLPAELITEAINDIISLSGGTIIANVGGHDHIFSTSRGCPECNTGYLKPDPEDFSFNSRRGRCQECNGLGVLASQKICPSCQGSRIVSNSLHVKINQLNIYQVAQLTALELQNLIKNLNFSSNQQQIAETILSEIKIRINRLLRLGLEYLPLSRSSQDLSKGELQRLKLANAMGSPLNGVLYIFDEPSAGLHPLDNRRILHEFSELKAQGNSVYIIEHDQDTIHFADHLIELGPGGGRAGGQIVYNGPAKKYPSKVINNLNLSSITNTEQHYLHVESGPINNIKNLKIDIPLQQLVSICGVSGSGKSTLLNEVILNSLDDIKVQQWETKIAKVSSDLKIDRLLIVDQSPIGKNSRSTPASYLKIWDEVRKLLAQTPLARTRGWNASYFSYNSAKSGRCPECNGAGLLKLEMSFLADAKVECPACQGRRYTDETLSVKYLQKSATEILNLTFEEAKSLFTNYPKIYRILKSACDLGLGYLSLGQPSTTLSGGECQRLKLAEEFSKPSRGHTVYILDEPSVGLHHQDVAKLLAVLRDVIGRGESVILIEHDPLIIQNSDFLIEMGPGAGDLGGQIVFSGSPKKAIKANTTWGKILKSSTLESKS